MCTLTTWAFHCRRTTAISGAVDETGLTRSSLNYANAFYAAHLRTAILAGRRDGEAEGETKLVFHAPVGIRKGLHASFWAVVWLDDGESPRNSRNHISIPSFTTKQAGGAGRTFTVTNIWNPWAGIRGVNPGGAAALHAHLPLWGREGGHEVARPPVNRRSARRVTFSTGGNRKYWKLFPIKP